MPDHEPETKRDPADRPEPDDDLLEEQQGKGYGDDEGERDPSLPDE